MRCGIRTGLAGGVSACLLLIVSFSFTQASDASFIMENMLPAPTVLDFSNFASGSINEIPGPIQIGGPAGENIEFTGNPNNGLYASSGDWGLSANGWWGRGRLGFLGHNNARPGTMIVTFIDAPVASVGAFMNHCPDCVGDLILTAYGAEGVLLEIYNVSDLAPIETPGGLDAGAFRGIARASADIKSFHVFGYVPVIDDLAFSRLTSIPEPSTAALFAIGLTALASYRRRALSAASPAAGPSPGIDRSPVYPCD